MANLDACAHSRGERRNRLDNLLSGAATLFRSFPLSVFPPRQSLWEQTRDNIEECWQKVGYELRGAMNSYEEEQGHETRAPKRVRRADNSIRREASAMIVRRRKETFCYVKHDDSLDPELQKALLKLVRETLRDDAVSS